MTPLLEPAFVRELEVLRRRLEIRARSGRAGGHVAPRRGGAAEFLQHRAYTEGDDVRRVDFRAYARTGEPVLKIFRAEEDALCRLLLDRSASMTFGAPQKLDVARRLAAAIGYLALAAGERAQVLEAKDGLSREHPFARGRAGVVSLLRALDPLDAGGRTDLARTVDAVVRRATRPGLLAVLSDFLDPGPVLETLTRAALSGHDVALVHVFAREEIEPDLDGDVALEDAETGEVLELVLDAATLDAHARRFADLCESLRGWARSRGARYVRTRTDAPVEEVVRRFLSRGQD